MEYLQFIETIDDLGKNQIIKPQPVGFKDVGQMRNRFPNAEPKNSNVWNHEDDKEFMGSLRGNQQERQEAIDSWHEENKSSLDYSKNPHISRVVRNHNKENYDKESWMTGERFPWGGHRSKSLKDVLFRQGVSNYMGGGFTIMNNFLRNRNNIDRKGIQGWIGDLGNWDIEEKHMKAIMRMARNEMLSYMKGYGEDKEKYKGDEAIKFRGLNNNPFVNLKKGNIIRDPGFMSTSWSAQPTESFAQGGPIMNIYNPERGFDVNNDMGWQGENSPEGGQEQEVIYPPHTELTYLGNERGEYFFDANGYSRVDDPDYGKWGWDDYLDDLQESKTKLSQTFLDRMNDFQFELVPDKKYSQFTSDLDD